MILFSFQGNECWGTWELSTFQILCKYFHILIAVNNKIMDHFYGVKNLNVLAVV